jgi:amino acid adenylation domain-containing protein
MGVEVGLRSFFEEATVEGLAKHVELALESSQAKSVAPSIKPIAREGRLPLSFAQQRLWFLNQLQPEDTSYNMPAATRMTGDLDVEALEQSLTEIIRRHEVLRTILVMEDDEPTQVILPAQPVHLPPVDLSHIPADEREEEVMRLATAEARRPFALNQGPLIRFTLLRLDLQEHVLLLNMHHTVFDGWSIAVLINELTALYGAYHSGHDSPLAELPVQYADYAVWQREWLQGEVLERQLDYWKKQFAVAPPALNLPIDKPRQAVRTINGWSEPFRLSPSLVASLKALGQEEGATLFMVLLAAFQVLLSRYTAQADVSVGTVVSNRNRAEVEGLIGFFVNMLVMRGDLGGDPSFREYLRRVREVALEAYAHQDVPFEILVESLQVERNLNRTPLFQVSFVLQNAPVADLELAGVKLTRVELQTGQAQFDLSLVMTESEDGGIVGSITYDTDLFYAATLKRMTKHLRTLMESAVARSETSISQLSFLTEAEREELLFTYNQTDCPYPSHALLHTLFEEHAARTPLRSALRSDSSHVTYAELNARANQLAHHLRTLGIGPEHLVGVCLNRSVEMVVALLAILKAGAAYVPLDPDYPRERLAFMLEDARLSLIVTEQALRAKLPDAAETLCLDTASDAIARQSFDNLPCAVAPDNLVYCIYTSGSTGRPKGAMLSHRGIVNCINWMQETYGLDEGDRFLLKTSLNFDPSVWEIFWPLSVGAQIVVAQPDRHADPSYLLECIREHGVTCLYFVPSMLKAFVEEAGEDSCESVRYVICGGEALSIETMAECMRVLPAASLHHSYGPTETSIAATEWECDEVAARRWGVVPMGLAMGNTRLYILDERGEPVPTGVTGELYIGGEGLARGYLHRPALTAERFLPDPFSGAVGARLYRTGDLVRYRAEGVVEYVGRVDYQVKLRGYRVELGEVEAVVRRHSGVRECVAEVRRGEGGEQRLVCHVVKEGEVGWGELREWVKERVPEYMVPGGWVEVLEMPLTANGKVDRRALAAAAIEGVGSGGRGRGARSEVEKELVKVWEEVLGKECGSVEEDFFEAGGHSLLATRMMSQVRRRMGVEVGLRSFFEEATVEGLAKHVELALESRAQSRPPSIVRASREQYRLNTTRQGKPLLPEALRKEAVQE